MEAIRQFCIDYPILQAIELVTVLLCVVPSGLLLITVQRAPFHVNCRVLISLWAWSHLIEYLVVVIHVYRMAQYENNEISRSFFVPAERTIILITQLIVATVATFLELGITLERAASVCKPAAYHNSSIAVKYMSMYLCLSIVVSIFVGWLAKEGPQTTATLIAAVILNCLDIASFLSNIAVLVYCRRQYEKIFAKTSLNARYQVREANHVAQAMLPAYISMIVIKILIAVFTWTFTFGIEKAGLFFLNEPTWICLQLLNNGCGAAFFLLKHERLRLRLTELLLRRKSLSLVMPVDYQDARGDQYFEMLQVVWK